MSVLKVDAVDHGCVAASGPLFVTENETVKRWPVPTLTNPVPLDCPVSWIADSVGSRSGADVSSLPFRLCV